MLLLHEVSTKLTKPSRVKPISYSIELFDLELEGSFSYQGLVNIDVNLKSAITTLTLNANQLRIHSAVIGGKTIHGWSFNTRSLAF